MKDKEITIIQWEGMEIEISFCRNWSDAFAKIYGFNMSHFEIKTRSPERAALPITETGYRSIFTPEPDIAEFASPTAYILAILDHAAQSPERRSTREYSQQYSLF